MRLQTPQLPTFATRASANRSPAILLSIAWICASCRAARLDMGHTFCCVASKAVKTESVDGNLTMRFPNQSQLTQSSFLTDPKGSRVWLLHAAYTFACLEPLIQRRCRALRCQIRQDLWQISLQSQAMPPAQATSGAMYPAVLWLCKSNNSGMKIISEQERTSTI